MPTKMSELGDIYDRIVSVIKSIKPKTIISVDSIDSDDEGGEELTSGIINADFLDQFLSGDYSDYEVNHFVEILTERVLRSIQENLLISVETRLMEPMIAIINEIARLGEEYEDLVKILQDIHRYAIDIEHINADVTTFGPNGVFPSPTVARIDSLLAEAAEIDQGEEEFTVEMDGTIGGVAALLAAPAPVAEDVARTGAGAEVAVAAAVEEEEGPAGGVNATHRCSLTSEGLVLDFSAVTIVENESGALPAANCTHEEGSKYLIINIGSSEEGSALSSVTMAGLTADSASGVF